MSFYTVPTDAPEADGTFAWNSTSMVLVQLECGEHAVSRLHLRGCRQRRLLRTSS